MTDTRSTFTARGTSDLLDLLPALFGFSPKESFIAIATHGENRRFGFRLRMDLPSCQHAAEAAAQAADYLRKQEPDGAILIAVTERADDADALMAAVLDELSDIPIHEAIRTDGEFSWSYGSGEPGEAVPYVSRCSPAVLSAIVEGMQILPDRAALVERFAAVSGSRLADMTAATEKALGVALNELSDEPKADLGVVGLANLQPILDLHAAGRPLTDEHLATLAIWVSAVRVRDEVWSRIRRETAETALDLWTAVARSVVDPFEAPVLSLAAFAAWLSGDGTQALIAVERALAVEPGYSMAQLILRTLDTGMSPEKWKGFSAANPATS